MRRGRRVVAVVDEAQNLAADVLEQVRLLTNLETETQKLLQIILIGQPELRTMLERNDLRQLAQRITGRYHLEPLSREESAAYLRHRLRIAGATQEIFTRGALAELYRASGGIPRLLNVIGDRALLGGYTEDRHLVNGALARRAASEVSGRRVVAGMAALGDRWCDGAAARHHHLVRVEPATGGHRRREDEGRGNRTTATAATRTTTRTARSAGAAASGPPR